jgi:trehalose 6-phosphate phosphatase
VDALYRSSGGAMALISGRPLADLDRLFPGHRWPAAGQHGLERREANGRLHVHRVPVHRLDRVRRRLARVVVEHPRLLLEDKGLSLALHYRRAPRLAGFVHRVMHRVVDSLGTGYCLQHGKRVVEVAPAGKDKGVAISAYMREAPFRGRLPIFIGDDVTDEFGFAVVNHLGGYSVKVGPGRTSAEWRLKNVRAVRSWLEHGRPVPARNRRRAGVAR